MEIPLPKRTGTRLWFILALAALLRFSGLGVKQLWLDEILLLPIITKRRKMDGGRMGLICRNQNSTA